MANSRTKNTLLNAAGGIVVKLSSMLTAFIVRSVFLYVLGIEYAGVSSVFTDVLTVLSFAELGIGTAITYALYKPIAEHDEQTIAKYMSAYKRIYTTIACVILCIGLCLIPFLNFIITDAPDIVEDLRLIYLLYLLNTSVSYLLIYKTTFLTAAQKDYLVSKYKVIVSLVKAVVECCILLIFKNFIADLLVSIAFHFIQNYVVAKVAEREYPILKQKSQEKLSDAEKKKISKDVRALALYKVSGTVLNGTDSIITSSFLGTANAGILGNYNLIQNQVYSFVMQLFTATSASIGNLAATSDEEHQYNVFQQMLFVCFWIYCFCATSLWTLFNPFMIVWQHGKHLFAPIVVACLVTEFYIRGMLSPITQFRTSNGLFIQGKYRPVIMAVINIFVSIVLAKLIGMAGIILGTIISRASTQLWYDPWLIYKNVFKRPVKTYFCTYIFYGAITVGCCCLSSALLNLIYPTNDILKVLIGVVISVVVPNSVIVILYFKNPLFKETLKIIKRIIKRKL